MKIYEQKLERPQWFSDPATNRQRKVLRFFGVAAPPEMSKGVASGVIARIFQSKQNKQLWYKYVFVTGDDSRDSDRLRPYDLDQLRAVEVPADWLPTPSSRASGKPSQPFPDWLADVFNDGTPFDSPVPQMSFRGMKYAFTGGFVSGTRIECIKAVEDLGAVGQQSVTSTTDYLIVGGNGSANWSEGTHGRKLQLAVMMRMDTGKPAIVTEADWLEALKLAAKAT